MCKAKLKGIREMCCRSDGTQKLPPCTQRNFTGAVYLTVVLRNIAYKPYCTGLKLLE